MIQDKFYKDSLSTTYKNIIKLLIGLLFIIIIPTFIYVRGPPLYVFIVILMLSAAHIWTMIYYRLTRKIYVNEGVIYMHSMTKKQKNEYRQNTYYPSESGILDFEFRIDNIKKIEIVNLKKNKLEKPKNMTQRAKTIKVMNKEKTVRVEFHKPLTHLNMRTTSSSFTKNPRRKERYEPLEELYFSVKNPEEFIKDIKTNSKTF